MAGDSFLHEIITGLVTALAGVLAWVGKTHAKRIDNVEDCTRKIKADMPDRYISIRDCDRIHQDAQAATAQMLDRMDQGFTRLHGRIDQLQTEAAQRHDRLRDLIDERTRK